MAFNLDPSDKIFVELKTGQYPWWDHLKNNKDISIQIHKNNKIDVYYNSGAILGGLKYNEHKKAFSAKIHTKYIPLEKDDKYMTLALTNADVKITNSFVPMSFSNFENDKISKIIARIGKYHPSNSEKAKQHNLATSDPYIIDAEFRFDKSSRVDLVRLDMDSAKIVFIEIKTISDARLFSDPEDPNNISHQLEKYSESVKENKEALLDYYRNVLQIKNDLGIAKPPIKGLSLNGWQIEPRPLLVLCDCTQKWIDTNADGINKKIDRIAYGAYYFGSTDSPLDLVPPGKIRNRYVF